MIQLKAIEDDAIEKLRTLWKATEAERESLYQGVKKTNSYMQYLLQYDIFRALTFSSCFVHKTLDRAFFVRC